MKTATVAAAFILALFCLQISPALAAAPGPTITIEGPVRQPIRLDMAALAALRQFEVKHNGVSLAGQYHGVFHLAGPSLKDVLRLAGIGKKGKGFPKMVDAAFLIGDAAGRRVLVSWGEVFHHNPGRNILAISSRPIMPKKNCAICHKPEEYQPFIKQLKRPVGLPKLALAGDYYDDRALEKVTSIRVVAPQPGEWGPPAKKLFSPRFTIAAPGHKPRTLEALPKLPRQTVATLQAGEGKGFHGRPLLQGVAVAGLLDWAGIKGGPTQALVFCAPDGYRTLVSWGELFLNPLARRIILADLWNGKPIVTGGRFVMATPDDLWADRWLKAVAEMRLVDFAAKP